MKICMFTNTYTPHVGGVAGSVHQFAVDCMALDHEVLVVAPEFEDMPEDEEHVFRVPAIQNFNGSDFSVSLPAPFALRKKLDEFQPDIIHSHHPFLLGDTALRVAALNNRSLVFTYHTMYEEYAHYVPAESEIIRNYILEISLTYTDMADVVVAPSESVRTILSDRGTHTPIVVIPTGVDFNRFSRGDGTEVRRENDIPKDSLLLGHVGRFAPEKNLKFLAESVAQFLQDSPTAYFLLVGDGPDRDNMERIFALNNVENRVIATGVKKGQRLVDCYHAMDVLIFTSKTETQGMVLSESMAAGTPVIGLDAPAVRDIIVDTSNGFLVREESVEELNRAVHRWENLTENTKKQFAENALNTARSMSANQSVQKLISLYDDVIAEHPSMEFTGQDDTWDQLLRALKKEWDIWERHISAGIDSVTQKGEE